MSLVVPTDQLSNLPQVDQLRLQALLPNRSLFDEMMICTWIKRDIPGLVDYYTKKGDMKKVGMLRRMYASAVVKKARILDELSCVRERIRRYREARGLHSLSNNEPPPSNGSTTKIPVYCTM